MKNYRVRDDEEELIKAKLVQFVSEGQRPFVESDVLHALIRYKLDTLTIDDVIRYREQVLGRIE